MTEKSEMQANEDSESQDADDEGSSVILCFGLGV